jgi:hypothetical protein
MTSATPPVWHDASATPPPASGKARSVFALSPDRAFIPTATSHSASVLGAPPFVAKLAAEASQ